MNKEQFVDAMVTTVFNSSIQSTLKTIEDPMHIRKNHVRQDVAKWYSECSETEKAIVLYVITRAVRVSLFNVFCVLDRSECIDDEHGEFELYYKLNGKTNRLNSDVGPDLHDIFNAKVHPNMDEP